MSSWIPSLFNPFTDDDNPNNAEPFSPNTVTERSPTSGAKDDLSAVFRGVAAFLAPPQAASSSVDTIEGIKNDLAEIQGSFRSGLSLISSKLSSNLMQLQNQFNDEYEEVDDDEALGISEEVLDFVLKISRRPELWTDFPLFLPDDFDMSDAQSEHAANIVHLVSEFETLRQKICSQMSEAKFWLIYFILLLPRLDEEELEFLSSPQVVEARETLLNKLQNKKNEVQESSEKSESSDSTNNHADNSKDTSKQKDESAETADEIKQTKIADETETCHQSKEVDTQNQYENEEDVSFSDLEDDNDDSPETSSEPKEKKTSVELGESSGVEEKGDQHGSKDKDSEGEDWLTVDDTDFDNLAAT